MFVLLISRLSYILYRKQTSGTNIENCNDYIILYSFDCIGTVYNYISTFHACNFYYNYTNEEQITVTISCICRKQNLSVVTMLCN